MCFVLLSADDSEIFWSIPKENAFYLTLSSIYTHFNTMKKKLQENIVGKGEIAQNAQLHLFPQCFLYNLYLKIP